MHSYPPWQLILNLVGFGGKSIHQSKRWEVGCVCPCVSSLCVIVAKYEKVQWETQGANDFYSCKPSFRHTSLALVMKSLVATSYYYVTATEK
jgi:hypothetical protein